MQVRSPDPSPRFFKRCLAAVLIAAASAAQAGLVHDLRLTGDNLSGRGQITFTSMSGNDVSGVSAFSFVGTAFLPEPSGNGDNPFDLGLDDLTGISWSIDDDWNLSIGLASRTAILTAPSFCLNFLINSPLFLGCTVTDQSPLFPAGTTGAGASFLIFGNPISAGGPRSPSTAPVHAIPTPGSLLLVASGLLGMFGCWRRRRTEPRADKLVSKFNLGATG